MKQTKGVITPAATYHADPAYSATDVKVYHKACPEVFYKYKYGSEEFEHPTAVKTAFRAGELCHAFTLEPDRAKVAYGVCGKQNTKAGKIQAEEMLAKGIEPITSTEYELASNVANAVRKHPVASKLLSGGQPELSFWVDDKDTGLACKARADTFSRTVARYLYHLQAAHYLQVTGAKKFVFVAVEKVFPFAVSVTELDPDALALGLELRNEALKGISQCHTDSYWPSYTEKITTISLPKWASY
jgi:hypothetical protein